MVHDVPGPTNPRLQEHLIASDVTPAGQESDVVAFGWHVLQGVHPSPSAKEPALHATVVMGVVIAEEAVVATRDC
jgi:hypothetical protein